MKGAPGRVIRAGHPAGSGTTAYRYPHVEQLETDDHLLFSATTEAAERVEKQTGVTPVYFGLHHLDLETGHVGGSESEQVAFS